MNLKDLYIIELFNYSEHINKNNMFYFVIWNSTRRFA